MLVAVAVAVMWMGLYPKPVTDMTDASVDKLLKHVAVSKIK
jgi:NADH-quinone oxidoreductase subunit M